MNNFVKQSIEKIMFSSKNREGHKPCRHAALVLLLLVRANDEKVPDNYFSKIQAG